MLDKGAICGRLGVSRFPVSETLARLQAEGLVDILPQRGSAVSQVRIVVGNPAPRTFRRWADEARHAYP